ncbi:MAG: right-handed parallel beta-helix repeat-containing protein, partial [Fidelibacterota bacterium]
MKKTIVISMALIMGLGLTTASAQTPIDGSEVPYFVTTSGDYQFTWTDTLFVTFDKAANAADSAKVDSCITTKSIFELNADNITLDGNGKVLVGAGGTDPPSSTYDVQPIWPNRIYADTTAFDNIYIHDLTIIHGRIGIYLTKLSNSLVENVTVKECYRGVYPQSKSSTSPADGPGGEFAVADTVRNCTLLDINRDAIAVRGPGHQILNNTITNTFATHSSSIGILIGRSASFLTTGVLVKGNVINGGHFLHTGIRTNRSGTNTYEDNEIYDVYGYGVRFNGHLNDGLANENVFTNTTISLAGVDEATGVYFDALADNNLFQSGTIDSAGVAIMADGETHGNIIKNCTLTNSSIADVDVSENSSVFMVNTTFDTAGSNVEPGSAIFFGEGFTVTLTVTTPWDIPGPWDVSVYNVLDDKVGTFATDANGVATFKLAETGVSADADTMLWGAQNPFTLVVETGDLYASYEHELSGTYTTDTSLAIDMDIMWEPPIVVVTSEDYTFDVANDTLMLNYLWAETAEDSAAVTAAIDECRETANLSIIQLNADHLNFDGNNQVIYGPNSVESPDQYDIQGIWPNKIYADTTALTDITIVDATVQFAKTAIYLTEVRNGLVEGCTVLDAYRGIYPNSKQNKDASGCIIRDNTLTNVEREAISVRGPGHKILDNTIIASRELHSSSAGIQLSRGASEFTTGVEVTGNKIYGGSFLRRGIRADASGDNTYRQNKIYDVLDYGLSFNSHNVRGPAEGNQFIQTDIFLSGPDEAIGIYFESGASYNLVDTVTIDSAAVAIKGTGGSRVNEINHALITASSQYDVAVTGGSSVLITNKSDIDDTKVSVEQGSAIYFGSVFMVDVEVLFENSLPLVGLDVIVTNAGGDTVGTFTTDEEGMAYVDVAAEGITFGGYSATQNPFTFTVVDTLDEGWSGILGSITETITEDTEIILSVDYLGTEAAAIGLPTEFALAQNYPNPFNPTTTIRYDLPVQSHVKLRVFDMTGRTLCTLVEANQQAGYHRVIWDGRDQLGRPVATGLYFFEIVAGDF